MIDQLALRNVHEIPWLEGADHGLSLGKKVETWDCKGHFLNSATTVILGSELCQRHQVLFKCIFVHTK